MAAVQRSAVQGLVIRLPKDEYLYSATKWFRMPKELHERASIMPRLMNSNLHSHIVFAYHSVNFRIYAEEVRALAAGLPD